MGSRNEFLARSLEHWKQAIAGVVGPIPPVSSTWHGLDVIHRVLRPFMGSGLNHAHYPTGGGHDYSNVEMAAEANCLSFTIGDRLADIVKPRTLTLEYFSEYPRESFLLLELDELTPNDANESLEAKNEEALEYPPGSYLSREVWERGYLHHDEYGREIRLPADSRPVTRWFGGKILIVAKGSLWNNTPATYDGRHNAMTTMQIRAVIERSL